MIFDYADVISDCSSINIRETAEERKPYYARKKVPLYGVTENEKNYSMKDWNITKIT